MIDGNRGPIYSGFYRRYLLRPRHRMRRPGTTARPLTVIPGLPLYDANPPRLTVDEPNLINVSESPG